MGKGSDKQLSRLGSGGLTHFEREFERIFGKKDKNNARTETDSGELLKTLEGVSGEVRSD